MSLGFIYERANKTAYEIINTAIEMGTAQDLAGIISNDVFPTIINKVSETILRSDVTSRNYSRFKRSLKEFGRMTEYLASNMVRAVDTVPNTNGTVINDHVIAHPDIKATYSYVRVTGDYPLYIDSAKFEEMIDRNDVSGLSSVIGMAFQALYDGIEHDHDMLIPALFGTLYSKSTAKSKRSIPAYTGDAEEYAKRINATLSKAVRDLTTWRTKNYNLMNMDMSDKKEDLVLVIFDAPITSTGETVLDIISSQIQFGAMSRASALGSALGVEVYEMPAIGNITTDIAQAYAIGALEGMQTVDMSAGEFTLPYPQVKMALVGRNALNVGAKSVKIDTARSARTHSDITWAQNNIELAYGAGQAIFFEEEVTP